MANTISTNKVGFKNLEHSVTIAPLVPYLKIDGFASNGISWDRPQPATTRLGADGQAVVNQKPVLYSGTFSLLPTSNARKTLDAAIEASTAKFGKRLVDYTVVWTTINYTTGTRTVYTGGSIEEFDAGDTADLDNGQGDKQYRVTFTDRIISPL